MERVTLGYSTEDVDRVACWHRIEPIQLLIPSVHGQDLHLANIERTSESGQRDEGANRSDNSGGG